MMPRVRGVCILFSLEFNTRRTWKSALHRGVPAFVEGGVPPPPGHSVMPETHATFLCEHLVSTKQEIFLRVSAV
jgi:hypothetical protein